MEVLHVEPTRRNHHRQLHEEKIVVKRQTFLMKGEFLMSVVFKPVNLGLLSKSFCVVCSVPRPF